MHVSVIGTYTKFVSGLNDAVCQLRAPAAFGQTTHGRDKSGTLLGSIVFVPVFGSIAMIT